MDDKTQSERSPQESAADENGRLSGADQPIQSAPQTSPVAPPAKRGLRHLTRRKKVAILVAVVIAAAGATGYVLIQRGKNDQPAVSQQQPAPQTPDPAAKANEAKTLPDVGASEQELALHRFTHPTTGETWLPEWKALPDQKLWKDNTDTAYYEVGARNGNTIIASVQMQLGEVVELFEIAPDKTVKFVYKPDADWNDEYGSLAWYKTVFVSKVKVDETIHYDSLTLPRSLTLQNGHVLKKSAYNRLGDRPSVQQGQTVTDAQKFGDSTVQLLERSDTETSLTSIGYGVVLPLHTRIMMEFQPLEVDLKDYSWLRGDQKAEDSIVAIARGCGGLNASVTRADTLNDDDVQLAGTSASGKQVYELKDIDHQYVKKAYDEFKEQYPDDASYNKYPGTNQEDFVRHHALVLYKDDTGQWFIYTRNDFHMQGGCAKPVVYLYPQQAQQISVQVGATVTVSDPFYDPLRGWKVTAYPGGSLLVGGRLYDSLFWEGPGNGEYPAITAGTVVKTADAPATMRAQLAAQGLTPKESDDFMEYWQSKLPSNKPYVRLTWFTTQQMNRLAPLAVSPKPDTTIRVFLDFEGLDTPITLPTQQLQSTPRNGFTLVEWGGLAHQPLGK